MSNVKKIPMHGIVPGDEAGTSEKYRKCRVVGSIGNEHIPICWTHLATDGSISFGLYMGDEPLTKIGEASINPNGTISFDTEVSLSDIPLEERKKTHLTLHPSGVCHIRFDTSQPITRHLIDNWFPVQKGFLWIQAYTAPLQSLPRTEALRKRDGIVGFANAESSARIEVVIFPRTKDFSVPIANEHAYSFVGGGPHHIVRVTIDSHASVSPTIVVRNSNVALL